MMEAQTTITIVHFNDVYNIEFGSQEPVGGAARFKTAVQRLADRDPLILFSGDALNPALMSSVTHGRQMIPVLNAIGVHCALYGNHDFDHGVDNLVKVPYITFNAVPSRPTVGWLVRRLADRQRRHYTLLA